MDFEMTSVELDNCHVISVGLCYKNEHGDLMQLYCQTDEYLHLADSWVVDNVIPNLPKDVPFITIEEMGNRVREFLEAVPGDIIILTDVGAFEWMCFLRLMGGTFNRPENVCYINIDLATILFFVDQELIKTDRKQLLPESVTHDLRDNHAGDDAYLQLMVYERMSVQ
jgi:hypothetical protein